MKDFGQHAMTRHQVAGCATSLWCIGPLIESVSQILGHWQKRNSYCVKHASLNAK